MGQLEFSQDLKQGAAMRAEHWSGYSNLEIVLHWLVAALVLFLLFAGHGMTVATQAEKTGVLISATDQFFADAHYWAGTLVLVLVWMRMIVRLVSGTPDTQSSGGYLAVANAVSHWLFYLLLAAVPVTGLLGVYVSETFSELHLYAKPAFAVLIGVHALLAFLQHVVLKDESSRRKLIPAL